MKRVEEEMVNEMTGIFTTKMDSLCPDTIDPDLILKDGISMDSMRRIETGRIW